MHIEEWVNLLSLKKETESTKGDFDITNYLEIMRIYSILC